MRCYRTVVCSSLVGLCYRRLALQHFGETKGVGQGMPYVRTVACHSQFSGFRYTPVSRCTVPFKVSLGLLGFHHLQRYHLADVKADSINTHEYHHEHWR